MRWVTVRAAILVAMGACGGGGEGAGAGCPFELPAGCSGAPPSYATDVGPVVARRCVQRCHQPGGVAQMQPLSSYLQLSARRGAVLGQLYRCRMPPAPEPPLSFDDGALLLDWLACGAPDN
jgi:hypothetical protein